MTNPKTKRRGRPSKAPPGVSPAAVREIRQMAKAYIDARLWVRYCENVRSSLLRRAGVEPQRCGKAGRVTYNTDEVKGYPEKDRAVLYQYITDKETVLCVENGIASIENAVTREIAGKAIVEGKSCENIASEIGISKRSVFREKDRAYRWIADYAVKENLVRG